MNDKHTKRITRHLDNITDERDDLFSNVNKIVDTAQNQIHVLLKSQSLSLSENEALLTYLTEIELLFCKLNHSVLKSLEVTKLPFPEEASFTQKQSSNGLITQELQDYYKFEQTQHDLGDRTYDFSLDVSNQDPKVVNNQGQNDSDLCKPLNEVTCSAGSNVAGSTSVVASENQQPPSSPTFSFSESILSTSKPYLHPLRNLTVPNEIPEQYGDMENQDMLRKNMKYFSEKMGFNAEGFDDLTSQFDKSGSIVAESVKAVTNDEIYETRLETTLVANEIDEKLNHEVVTDEVDLENNEKLNIEHSTMLLNFKSLQEPLSNTGAIRKQSPVLENLDLDTEFNVSTLEKESRDKVSSWLAGKTGEEFEKPKNTIGNAVEKIDQVKRYDREEKVKEEVVASMPNIKLIPFEPPPVIKNDLNSEKSESSSVKGSKKKSKVRKLNNEVVVYDIPQMEPLKQGDKCVFSHIVDPNEFYLQLVSDTSTRNLDLISDTLNKKFRRTGSSFKSKDEAFSKLGKFCYGYIFEKFKDWFRLQILDWKLDSITEEVKVQAIDFGFICTTSYSYLRELTTDLAGIPMMAIKCHFPLLYPIGSTHTNRLTKWAKSTIEVLCDIVNLSGNLAIEDNNLYEVVYTEMIDNSLGVDLVSYPSYNGDEDTLGYQLIEMGLAKQIVDYEDDPVLGELLDDVYQVESADNLNEHILGYDARDEARICRFTRPNGSCFKGKNCKLDHIQLKDGYTTDKIPIYSMAINDLIFPEKGDVIQVLVTGYVDICSYYVQMVKNPVNFENTNIVVDKGMADLVNAMNHPKLIAKYIPFKMAPAIGELVLAYNPIGKTWMRAIVRDIIYEDNSPFFIEVSPVDFGGDFRINIKNIRKMREDFMHLPFQVFQIYLDNYQHRSECDNNKANKFFEKHIFYKSFLAQILSKDPPFKVKLMTVKGREIGPTLVKQGFAELRTIDLHISEDVRQKGKLELY